MGSLLVKSNVQSQSSKDNWKVSSHMALTKINYRENYAYIQKYSQRAACWHPITQQQQNLRKEVPCATADASR